MKCFGNSCSIVIGSLLGAALTGCAGNTFAGFPDTPAEVSPGAIHGSVFGGHAPVVGAHVYVFEAGQTGYASAATSKLTIGSGTDTVGTYVLTDSSGSFNITGDYTCDANHPVYLAAAGGSSEQAVTATITKAVTTGNRTGTNVTYTTTFTANVSFSVGQEITFPATGQTGALTGPYVVLNGTTQTITAAPSSTTFEISYTVTRNNNFLTSTTTGTATSVVANPAIVNLAVLGLCPGVTNEFATTLSYVYMNEVSTVAAAEALGAFGSGPYNIGSSSTNLIGIKNAAINAGQLYDIQGSNSTVTGDGEGHIARELTPAGNGQVPQDTLDTLGNILASCVDSANIANSATDPTETGASVNCGQLFTYATSNGIPFGSTGAGTVPTDTATAAFNIAHYPAGNPNHSTGTTGFMAKLYALQASEAIPFSPYLTSAPNDFTIAISYPNVLNALPSSGPDYLGLSESIGIDATGNVWFTAQSQKILFEWSPVGVLKNYTQQSYIFGYLSLDPSGNAWTGTQTADAGETELSSSGVLLSATPPATGTNGYAGPYQTAYTTVTDSSGNAYVGSVIGSQSYLSKISSTGQLVSQTDLVGYGIPSGADTAHGVFDGAGYLWITSETGDQIDRLNLTTGAAAAGFPKVLGSGTQPEYPGIDHTNNAWIALQLSNKIDKVTDAGTITNPTGTIYLNHPFGSAVDGVGNVWISNRNGPSVTGDTNNKGSIVEIDGTTGAAISPSTNYTLGDVLDDSLNLAIDPSGDLWITNYTGGSITELMGPVAPVLTPWSAAAGENKLGVEP